MCHIILKPSGIESGFPMDIVRRKWYSNADGAGIAISNRQGDKVGYVKGIMSLKALEQLLTDMKEFEGWKETTVALHLRMATHGGKSKQLTHPFPTKDGDIHDLSGVVDEVMFHNGILSQALRDAGAPASEGGSDTTSFVTYVVPSIKGGDYTLLNGRIGHNKLLFIKKKGDFVIVNPNLGQWSGGFWHSNQI